MKWHMIVGSLVVSASLCTQGFSFELLDRMLGVGGGGCCEPKCGVAEPCPPKCCKPARRCAAPCPPKCAAPSAPKCAAPCAANVCCDLFGGLRGMFDGVRCGLHDVKCGLRQAVSCPCPRPCAAPCPPKCAAPKPKCCKPACPPQRRCKPACKPQRCCKPASCCRGGLLDSLFSCNRGCGQAHRHHCGCGMEYGDSAVISDDDDAPVPPVPPVPETDPSASLQQRHAVRPVTFGMTR